MTKQHKALELADQLESLSSPKNTSLTKMWARDKDPETAAELRRQHALIVQMREALKSVLTHEDFAVEASVVTKAESALTAATQYLEQP